MRYDKTIHSRQNSSASECVLWSVPRCWVYFLFVLSFTFRRERENGSNAEWGEGVLIQYYAVKP